MFRLLCTLYLLTWLQTFMLVIWGSRIMRLIMGGPTVLIPLTLYFYTKEDYLLVTSLSLASAGLFVSAFNWRLIFKTLLTLQPVSEKESKVEAMYSRLSAIFLSFGLFGVLSASVLIIVENYETLLAMLSF